MAIPFIRRTSSPGLFAGAGEHHDLVHELPEYRDKIHEMKLSNHHFAKLFDEYHEVDHEVRRIEQEIETPSDEYTEELKKKRLHLKDELFTMLKQA
jgi:uncharacterized protein YdcH (DUF465 family)